jgi:hypothetical protein
MKMNAKFLVAITVSGALLSGCATVGSVKRAQATADQAVTLAQQGNAAAQNAQATADGTTSAAQTAQATANGAQTAAEAADAKAVAAGTSAAGAQKTIDDHLARQRRYHSKKK